MERVTEQEQSLFEPIDHFRGARDSASPRQRLDRIRLAAGQFREKMLAGAPVRYFCACDLVRVPYPTRYGLRDACTVPVPFVHLLNRMFVVQFHTAERLKTLLVSPSDVDGNASTPFFSWLAQSFGPLQGVLDPAIAPRLGTVEGWLARLGLRPEQVDYITYDHLHTQDLRKWLGTHGQPGFFPNARLLVMRQEWISAQRLLPPQQKWYCPHGLDGIDPQRVMLLDGDVLLGEGVALIQTPGHTEGNHSIVVRTPDALNVMSENGISMDSYAPQHSRIPSLRRYAAQTGEEVVLNGNTLERGLDQYISMVQEKTIAGPSPRAPEFFNVLPTSELAPSWLSPGISPTVVAGSIECGQITTARERGYHG